MRASFTELSNWCKYCFSPWDFWSCLHASMSLSLYSSINLCVAKFCFKYLVVPYANPSDAATFPNTGSLPIKLNSGTFSILFKRQLRRISGHLTCSLRPHQVYFQYDPLNTDSPLTRRLCIGLSMSALTRFHCSFKEGDVSDLFPSQIDHPCIWVWSLKLRKLANITGTRDEICENARVLYGSVLSISRACFFMFLFPLGLPSVPMTQRNLPSSFWNPSSRDLGPVSRKSR